MFWLAVHFLLYGPAGFRDETLAAYVDRGAVYVLEEIGGETPTTTVTLHFPSMWRIEARTPCFRLSAKIMHPYPWFSIAGLRSEEVGCIRTELEDRFVNDLKAMQLSEVQGGVLILSGEDHTDMVFRAQP